MTISEILEKQELRLFSGEDYKFINRSDIVVLDMTKHINCDNPSLEKCLQNLISEINDFYDEMIEKKFTKNIVVFVRSHSYKFSNVIIKKKGIWGITDLSWINKNYKKTDNFEQADDAGRYYFGITEIKPRDLFNALNYSRLTRRMIILFTDEVDINNSHQYFSHSITDIKNSEINWTEAIDKLCINNNIVLKVDGAFDDKYVSISLFMKKELLHKLILSTE